MSNRIAIDVGGTFTDVVRLDPDGGLRFEKVPTTPAEPTHGVLAAFDRAEAPLDDTSMFTHGTTLGLNALLTRTGAPTAVIATKGFRDVYLLGRTAREGNYNIFYRKPAGLVERADTYEVDERMLFDGSVHRRFDEESARQVATEIRDRGYRAVAVAFLHSYANPDHEQAMKEVLLDVAPDLEVSLSSDLSREYREYERTSTAVLDAYIKPIIRTYLRVLQAHLDDGGFGGQFLMMRSGGGAMTAALAQDQPVNLILSGPAGGVVGAAGFAAITGEPNLVTVDMGGTSLDASLVIDGQPVLHQGAQFEGLPINTSSLYIHTIGAGGGSIAWLDEAGGLQVGPQSAGADPGPASYGIGGEQPTFTDAALVMGYLGEETPLGETLTLRRDLAAAALEPIARVLDMSIPELARGVVRISTTKITGAVRSITVELGRDPKDFALLAFGGAGGIVAVDVARELGMTKVIIPPGQGAFSAVGMLMADVQHDTSRTSLTGLADVHADTVAKFWAEMADESAAVLAEQGFAPSGRCPPTASMPATPVRSTPSPSRSPPTSATRQRTSASSSSSSTASTTGTPSRTRSRSRRSASAPSASSTSRSFRSPPRRETGAPEPIGSRVDGRRRRRGGGERLRPRTAARRRRARRSGGHRRAHGDHRDAPRRPPRRRRPRRADHHPGRDIMIDPITLEVIRHGLISACEEMARNLCRTSYNTVVYEIHDYGIGLHDRNGDIVADAPGIAVFTRGNDYGIKRSIEFLGAESMKPGDVFLNNYPYWSSAHTLDPLVFAPIHVDGELIGFSSCRVHVLDLMAKDMGYVLDSTDMFQEGIFFPAVRLYREGVINEDIFNIVKFNSRLPSHTIGDIQAEVSAVVTGVRRAQELSAKFGVDTVCAAMEAINDHGERLARAALSACPRARGAPSTTSTTTASTSTGR